MQSGGVRLLDSGLSQPLTGGERELVEPFLPMAATGPIPDLRRQFDAVMRRFRVGSPWRDIPERYGNWSTIYGQFHSWAARACSRR